VRTWSSAVGHAQSVTCRRGRVAGTVPTDTRWGSSHRFGATERNPGIWQDWPLSAAAIWWRDALNRAPAPESLFGRPSSWAERPDSSGYRAESAEPFRCHRNAAPRPRRPAAKSRSSRAPRPRRPAATSRSSRAPSSGRRPAATSRSSRAPGPRRPAATSRSTRAPRPRRPAAKSRSSRAPRPRRPAAKSRSSRAPRPRRPAAKSRSSRAPRGRYLGYHRPRSQDGRVAHVLTPADTLAEHRSTKAGVVAVTENQVGSVQQSEPPPRRHPRSDGWSSRAGSG
jgi:hypothetical protein